MTGVILAGGKNSRMGLKKAFIEIEGKKIIDRILEIIDDIFEEIIIVSNNLDDYKNYKMKVVKDTIIGKGPIGGILTGLSEAKHENVFITACDMPFIQKDLVKYIVKKQGFDLVIPKIFNRHEPLFAMYSKKSINIIAEQINCNDLKLHNLIKKIRYIEISESEIIKFDKNLYSFININTPFELENI